MIIFQLDQVNIMLLK